MRNNGIIGIIQGTELIHQMDSLVVGNLLLLIYAEKLSQNAKLLQYQISIILRVMIS